jgi:serine/threonine protein kinase
MEGEIRSEWMDIDIRDVPKGTEDLIAAPGHSHVYKYKERLAIKIVCGPRELEMMKLAGDCSITPVGRVFQRGRMVGIVMHLGQSIDPSLLHASAKRQRMMELIDLVISLHDKGLLHGDIKLANLLIAPDGSLRFCDFEGCQEESIATPPEEATLNWLSPARLRNIDSDMPQSRQDDFYALGLTIWELFTGKVPFAGLREDEVERKILAGESVDISKIQETDVREIVEKYLAIGGQDSGASGEQIAQ